MRRGSSVRFSSTIDRPLSSGYVKVPAASFRRLCSQKAELSIIQSFQSISPIGVRVDLVDHRHHLFSCFNQSEQDPPSIDHLRPASINPSSLFLRSKKSDQNLRSKSNPLFLLRSSPSSIDLPEQNLSLVVSQEIDSFRKF